MIVEPPMSAVPVLDSLSLHVDAILDAALAAEAPSPALPEEPLEEGAA